MHFRIDLINRWFSLTGGFQTASLRAHSRICGTFHFWRGAVVLVLMLGHTVLQGQQFFADRYDVQRHYGFTAGITASGYPDDSAGFSSVSLPYAGVFMLAEINRRVELQAELQYLVLGANGEAPYRRYRHSYFTGSISAWYRLWGFLQLGGGYLYGAPHQSKILTLSNHSASGVERQSIGDMGRYGRFMAGGMILLGDNLALDIQYGIPASDIPFSHFRVGLRYSFNQDREQMRFAEVTAAQQEAKQHAYQLRNGLLLVRLSSMRSSIEALEAHGRMEEAVALRQETHRENQELVSAFARYNFSKVLFFYDYHSHLVSAGRFDTILMNHRMEVLVSDTIAGAVYTLAHGSYHSPDTLYHMRHNPQHLLDHGIAPDSSAAYIKYTSGPSQIGGLLVMNQQFVPLKKPFPVYTPLLNPTIFRTVNRTERAVIKLNERLIKLLFEE